MTSRTFFSRAFETDHGWATGPLVAFNTETTGVDVDEDRIVTAFLGDGSTSGSAGLAAAPRGRPRHFSSVACRKSAYRRPSPGFLRAPLA